jgi:hypothetical protein
VHSPTYIPGHIYRIPPGATDLEDWDSHFHLLVAVHPQRKSATLLFGSSVSTDSACGAPAVVVQPTSQSGLSKPTFFYGPAIVVVKQTRLGSSRGDIQARLPEVRAALKKAIGYRTNPRYDAPREADSLRGAVVEVSDKLEARYQTRFFAILTKHEYSAKRRYQVLAPLYDVEPQATRGPVASIAMPPALQDFFTKGATNLHVPAEIVRSFWAEKAIIGVTDRTLDASLLERVEDAVCAHLSL